MDSQNTHAKSNTSATLEPVTNFIKNSFFEKPRVVKNDCHGDVLLQTQEAEFNTLYSLAGSMDPSAWQRYADMAQFRPNVKHNILACSYINIPKDKYKQYVNDKLIINHKYEGSLETFPDIHPILTMFYKHSGSVRLWLKILGARLFRERDFIVGLDSGYVSCYQTHDEPWPRDGWVFKSDEVLHSSKMEEWKSLVGNIDFCQEVKAKDYPEWLPNIRFCTEFAEQNQSAD